MTTLTQTITRRLGFLQIALVFAAMLMLVGTSAAGAAPPTPDTGKADSVVSTPTSKLGPIFIHAAYYDLSTGRITVSAGNLTPGGVADVEVYDASFSGPWTLVDTQIADVAPATSGTFSGRILVFSGTYCPRLMEVHIVDRSTGREAWAEIADSSCPW